MKVELHLKDQPALKPLVRVYDPELDDASSILSDICDFAHDYGNFVVSGFGQERWPTDVRTDLLVFLGQLPGALTSVKSNLPFDIDFYEQGLERRLSFLPAEHDYIASCSSYGNWTPDPAVEHVDRDSLLAMLASVRDEFMRFTESNFPDLVSHPWMRAWLSGNWVE